MECGLEFCRQRHAMYICVCNAITERQVRASVDAGANTLADLQFELGVATCCGCCAEAACEYLPAGASARHQPYETTPAANEAMPAVATSRRFPVHHIAKAA